MDDAVMTASVAAATLNGGQYREEGSPELFAAMKAAGLVAVYGASDDLVEFRGAIEDESGASGGATIYLTPTGLLENDCDDDRCPHYARAKKAAAAITVKWSTGGFSWRYETAIPHETFIIKEDDDTYCEGIVFALKDVGSSEPAVDTASAWEEKLNLSDEARKLINSTPMLLSLLYDLNLLPEVLASQEKKTPGLIKAYHRLYGVIYAFAAQKQMADAKAAAGSVAINRVSIDGEAYTPNLIYYPDADAAEYVLEDGACLYEDIGNGVALVRRMEDRSLIGFRIENPNYWAKTIIEPRIAL